MKARYVALTAHMLEVGPNIGRPHSVFFGGGLCELRIKAAEGIARVFYCVCVDNEIVMLHSFIKKTNKTPLKEKKLQKKD